MYKYDEFDHQLVRERAAQFRDQTRRYLAGQLSEEEFKPLRLQNGLYIQRYAPMLRVAVPYGMLASDQLRRLAQIARKYDRGYAHISTRLNVQFNWPELERVPDILDELAEVEMHAIQTSGNCIRNITIDQFAGVAPDETVDPRPLAEIIRQCSTFHPEFALLPRKFKIAMTGAREDRAVLQMHDVGLELYRGPDAQLLIKVWVGGGLGRTPILGTVLNEALPWQHILTYIEAIVRVYNLWGRRDNSYKARIKILVKALGIEEFRRQVEAEWAFLKDGPNTITEAELERVAEHFTQPAYEKLDDQDAGFAQKLEAERGFANWVKRNVRAHKQPGYRSVTLSLKPTGIPPGDITAEQFEQIADLADRFSFGEVRNTHEQNIVLSDVRVSDLYVLWQAARDAGLATPNIGLITDIICCPGGDLCDLANAKSVPVARALQEKFDDLDFQHDIGEIELNISGCMNSCGHHHVGHIGVLGVDKDGSEWYQVSIGGKQGNDASLGSVIGPSFQRDEVAGVVERLIDVYVENRSPEERFIDVVRRLGVSAFKERVYADRQPGKQKVEASNV